VAQQRIAEALPLDESALKTMQAPKTATRVAFGTLVECGLIPPGSIVMDAKRRWRAKVRADGSLELNGEGGSLHKLGASVQGAPSCNGWTFWHVETAEGLKPVDALRQQWLLANEA
jgi:modification methylase